MDIETTSPDRDAPATAEQLSLLPTSEVPVQFRLDAATRARGRRHVAELRELLERRRAERVEAGRRLSRLPERASAPRPSAPARGRAA